ncbi:MAG TPA: sulfatase-like hydrolase/transferase [Gaiellaceae bacterium]|nr:sulfatase-like hydrolase/transferase [Gaiellaceae bacterium]
MNVLLVLVDSLNRADVPAYGTAEVPLPNLDRLARRAFRFDNHFVGSLPCMPARRELYAGFKEFLWRPWGPLEPADARLPRLVQRAGLRTAIVTDHYHYWEESANGYVQSFQQTELVRGHEWDNWRGPVPADERLPAWVERIERWRPGAGRRYYANVRDFETEEDFFPARTFRAAAARLASLRAPFFLQVESFDVHEPFHVPEPYRSRFGDPADDDRFTLWPPYQDPDALAAFMAATSPEELAFVRARYLGKVAMVDRWLGVLLDVLDERALWDDTAVLFTTDHGHDLGTGGVFGKQYPHRDSHARIPLLVWHPGFPGDGRGIDALTSTVDLFATVAELAGGGAEPRHGRSLVPLLAGAAGERDGLLYGTFGQGVCCTDGEWTIFKSPPGRGPLYAYSSLLVESQDIKGIGTPVEHGLFVPGVPLPQWRIPAEVRPLSHEDFLFHRPTDPAQERNLWDAEPTQRERMLDLLRALVESEGAPPEQLVRLGLQA